MPFDAQQGLETKKMTASPTITKTTEAGKEETLRLLTPFNGKPGTGAYCPELRPFDPENGFDNRVAIYLTDEDMRTFDNLTHAGKWTSLYHERAIVKDQVTGIRLQVARAACGTGCYCGAQIVGVMS